MKLVSNFQAVPQIFSLGFDSAMPKHKSPFSVYSFVVFALLFGLLSCSNIYFTLYTDVWVLTEQIAQLCNSFRAVATLRDSSMAICYSCPLTLKALGLCYIFPRCYNGFHSGSKIADRCMTSPAFF